MKITSDENLSRDLIFESHFHFQEVEQEQNSLFL